ncbi:MAG: hypothetical protein ABI557_14220 [Aureliella sp.]
MAGSPVVCLSARTLDEACAQIEPDKHGVLLQHPSGDATFTSYNWTIWPQVSEFMRELQLHAGLNPERWLPDMHVSTYTVRQLDPVPLAQ